MAHVDLGPVFIASFSSRGGCGYCGEDIDEGDEVRYSDGELIGQQCCGQEFEEANKETVSSWSARTE